jgi:hypothetical protein
MMLASTRSPRERSRAPIGDALGKRLELARRRRHRSEYGSTFFTTEAVTDIIGLAAALIEAVFDQPSA